MRVFSTPSQLIWNWPSTACEKASHAIFFHTKPELSEIGPSTACERASSTELYQHKYHHPVVVFMVMIIVLINRV
jgi:hypothetical protein